MIKMIHKSFDVKCPDCKEDYVLIQRKRPRTTSILCETCKVYRAKMGARKRAKDKACRQRTAG